MTEQDWLSSTDPRAMLDWTYGKLQPSGVYRPSERKLRLYACACWRHLWRQPHDQEEAEAVELWADGLCDRPCRHEHWVNQPAATDAATDAATSMWHGSLDDRRAGAALLRDVVGNPWRPVFWPDDPKKHARMRFGFGGPSDDGAARHPRRIVVRRAWMTPTVLSLAQAAYKERQADGTLDPLTLSVLADALEEAGCDNDDLLLHLRGRQICPACKGAGAFRGDGVGPCGRCGYEGTVPLPGPHVRGCWAVDLILGKE